MCRQAPTSTFDGEITFFNAAEERPGELSFADDWAPYARGAVINHDLACTHSGIVDPKPLSVIAETIGETLSA